MTIAFRILARFFLNKTRKLNVNVNVNSVYINYFIFVIAIISYRYLLFFIVHKIFLCFGNWFFYIRILMPELLFLYFYIKKRRYGNTCQPSNNNRSHVPLIFRTWSSTKKKKNGNYIPLNQGQWWPIARSKYIRSKSLIHSPAREFQRPRSRSFAGVPKTDTR